MKLLDLQRDPAAFRAALLIDTDAGPQPFAELMDPWQKIDFEALDSGWQRAVLGNKHPAKYQRGWLERARGHSKSLDLGIMAAWALFASRRRLSGIAAAGDQDQARLLRDAVGKLVYCNPWLSKVIEVQNYRIINTRTESTLDIISSDAPTSYGLTPDFVVCDELVHWKKRDLWDSLISSAAKRSTCMCTVITNAGLSDDWAWQTREAVRSDDNWYFSRLDGPVASWISQKQLNEQQRLLPSIAFRRLWLNEWTSGGGDALSPEIIDAAFKPDLRPQLTAQPGYEYICGVDLGVVRDSSAVCVLGIRRQHAGHGRMQLAHLGIWAPVKGQKVDLQDIEESLFDLHERFDFRRVSYDSWQMSHMASRLQAGGLGRMVKGSNRKPSLPMVEIPPTGQNLQRIATCVLEAFNDRRIDLFVDGDLKRDLHRLRVEERPYGFRLTSPRDSQGHGDAATALGLALLAASELAARPINYVGVYGDEPQPGDPFDSPLRRELRQREDEHAYERAEFERLLSGGADYDGRETWRALMRQMGRGRGL